MESKKRDRADTLAALLVIFAVALFATTDIMKIVPFFDPITSSTIFPYIHDVQNLIALSLLRYHS